MSEFGSYLRELRRQVGLTQEALAERLGVTNQYVSDVERGKSTPSYGYLRKLAAETGASVADLLRRGNLLDDRTVALEQEIAALVQQVPEFADIFEYARDHPENIPEVLRFARYLQSGAPEEAKESRAAPNPRRRPATADSA
jgi:transcriptional regulator with XRE-family HTH domain